MTREVRTRIAHEAALVEGQKLLESANAELIASKERAEAASRAKSLFLANMSHELRTPLNAIIGFAEIIRDQTFGPTAMARYSDYAKDVAESGQHLLGVISGILNIAKIEAGKAVLSEQIVSLPEIIDTAVTAVRAQAALKRLDFQVETPEHLPYLMADPIQLAQIAINLLSNAVKFTPEGGEIQLEVYQDIGGEIVLSVADTGIGMSPDEVMSALQPFVQIDNSLTKSYAGTGLGLPLATKLAELHGGSLAVESAKGIGTTVRVRLPARRIVKTPAALEPAA